MSRFVFWFQIGIIVLGGFAILVSIPYLVHVPEESTGQFGNPATTTNPAITPFAALKVRGPKATSTPPQPIPATTTPAPISKYGALLEEEARLGRVDYRDEQELWRGVVAVRCAFGASRAIAGSGIILDNEGHIATNNHVAGDAPNGSCEAIFPAFSENTGYRIRARNAFPAKIVALSGNNDNDIAILQVEKTADFQTQIDYLKKYYGWTGDPFSFIPYSFCSRASLGDKVIHYDWQVVNTASEGYEIVRTVSTVVDFLLDRDGTFYYAQAGQTPDYIVTDAQKAGGASGGLAFDASKDCVLGLTSRSGDTTLVLNINNPAARALIPRNN